MGKVDLNTCVKLYSTYAYHEDVEYQIDSGSIFHTWESVEKEFLLGKNIPHSDLYAVEVVARLSFATTDMVASELKLMKKMPKYKTVQVSNLDQADVRNSLIRMCKAGLLRCFTYNAYTNSKVKIAIYCASDIGVTIIKKRLYSNLKSKDTMLSLCPEEEAFRRLAANACVIALRDRYGYSKTLFNRQVYIPKLGLKRIYGKCESLDGDIIRIRIIEPLYFMADTARIPPERMEDANKERMHVLNEFIKNMLQKYPEENIDLKVIFLYENHEGLRKCTKMVVENLELVRSSFDAIIEEAVDNGESYTINKDNAPGIENIFFTSEPLLYHMGEEKQEFIKLSQVVNENGTIKTRVFSSKP